MLAMFARTNAARPGASFAAGFGRRARDAVAMLRLWRERAQQRRQLAALDDRLLRDIGLTRADVDAEIDKPFWRP